MDFDRICFFELYVRSVPVVLFFCHNLAGAKRCITRTANMHVRTHTYTCVFRLSCYGLCICVLRMAVCIKDGCVCLNLSEAVCVCVLQGLCVCVCVCVCVCWGLCVCLAGAVCMCA